MIPVTLTLRNFLSYGEQPQSLDFTGFRVACLSGDNGNGKSALLDAITYALWGQARKGRHDRKPDEGLLRLGSTHMSVEFTFDLDRDRYRVLRSFRRRPRSSLSELELQCFDPVSDQFRPLTQAGSPTVTQRRIDDLLSMDYDTFTNSAFLLQGQADAFTRKSPRERKQLLGRILGVGRYDRLQDAARRKLADLDERVLHLDRKIDDATEALTTRREVEAELTQATKQLEEAGQQLVTAEAERTTWQERLSRAELLRREQKWDEQGQADVAEGMRKLEVEESRLLEQRKEDSQLLEQASHIEAGAEELVSLQGALRDSDEHRTRIQSLQHQRSDAQRKIDAARHEVEQRLAMWKERRAAAEQEQARCQTLIDQTADIEAAWLLVSHARDQVARQREHRRAWEQLAQRRQKLEHEIDVEQQRLRERLHWVETERTKVTRKVHKEGPLLDQEMTKAQAKLAALLNQAHERNKLGETEAQLRTRLAHRQEQGRALAQEMEQLKRIHAEFSIEDEVSCPLCGTDLDDEHRRHIEEDHRSQQEKLILQNAATVGETERLQEELAVHHKRLLELAKVDEQVAASQQAVARLQSRQHALEEHIRASSDFVLEIEKTRRQLNEQEYCVEARAQLTETITAMEDVDYDAARLERAEATADDPHAQTRRQLLQEARQQQERAQRQAQTAAAQVEAGSDQLRSGTLAPKAQEQLADLENEIANINFDEARHVELLGQVEERQHAPLKLERLRSARSRRDQTLKQEQLQREERTRLQQRQRELSERQTQRDRLFAELAGVEQACAQALEAVTHRRAERDGLLERRGALRTRAEHLSGLAETIKQDHQERKQLQAQVWLHQQLVEAFGKDGIQALIIEHAIPEIEEEANAILRRLTENRIQLTIESIRDLKGGGSRETLDVKISDEVGERSYDLYSGGEAFRSDFALRLALSKVLARRAGTQLRTLIIDEGFGTQDRAGLEQLKESIHSICADFDKVIVVTHLEELKNAFPTQIEVTKRPDRGSEFEVRNLA